MWPDEHNAMLKTFIAIFFSFLVACVFLATASENTAKGSSQTAARHLEEELHKVSFIKFFFLSRTEKYSVKDNTFKEQSSLRIYRGCGNNCYMFMRSVISHLEKSTLSNCLPGQQNVLIEIGDKDRIIYSYFGHHIQYGGKCFHNAQSINGVIENSTFIFE